MAQKPLMDTPLMDASLMDASVISDAIESLIRKLESLDKEHLRIPFISNRIHEFKDKLIRSDPDLCSGLTDMMMNYRWYKSQAFDWPNAGLLTCFVYCTLYPKGHRIIREDLLNQWMAQDFLLSEGIGNGYFNKMLSEGVFHQVTYAYGTTPSDRDHDHAAVVHSCVMNPLAYDAARCLAAEQFAVFDGSVGGITIPQYTKYVAFHNLDDAGALTQVFDGDEPEMRRKTTTLMLFSRSHAVTNTAKFNISCLRSFPDLRVLNLHGLMQIAEPWTLEKSRNIGYLALSMDNAKGMLQCSSRLQTLRLYGSLPDLEISIKGLRRLYLTTMDSSLHLSPYLRILELSRCKSLNTLSAKAGNQFFSPSLRALRIFDCPKLLSLPNTAFLNRVEELVFHNCPRLHLTDGTAMNVLPKLRYLEIIGVHKLVELPSGILGAISLEYMMIGDCKRLKRLIPDGMTMQNLTSLRRLCVYNCPRLTALPDGIDTLSNLHAPYIRHCLNLVSSYYIKEADELDFISRTCLEREWKRKENQMPTRSSTDKKVVEFESTSENAVNFGSQMDSKFRQILPYFTLPSQIMQGAQTSGGTSDDDSGTSDDDSMSIEDWDKMKHTQSTLSDPTKGAEASTSEAGHQEEYDDVKKIHCSLFPRDYEFESDTLVRLWMAGGFLNVATGILKEKPMEDVGNYYFDKLVRDGYLLTSRVDILSGKEMFKVNSEKLKAFLDKLRMIDAQDLYAKSEVIEKNKAIDGSTKHLHLSLSSDDINQTTFEILKTFTELRTLLLIRNYGSSLTKVPYDLFLALRKLQSLDLSGSHISEVPSSIEYVTDLHFLDLSFTLIEELPESLGCLANLQTLKLRGCKRLFALPSSTHRLVSLRHLDFDVLGQLTCMPPGIGALTELRTLSAFIVGKENGHRITELNTLNHLRGSFCISGLENISIHNVRIARLWCKYCFTKMQLRWNPNYCMSEESDADQPDDTIAELRPDYFDLKELVILYFPGKRLPTWMGDAQFVKLVSIRLIRCENIELNIGLGELPLLKSLHIDQMNRVTEIDDGFLRATDDENPIAFEKLEELTIDGMHSLKAWTDVQKSDFPILSKLIVRGCPELTALSFASLIGSLKHLEVSECAVLQSLEVAESFPSLETLIIDDCPLFPSLETLIIDDCPLLKKRYSKSKGEDWDKIKHIECIWIDLEDVHSEANTDSSSDSGSDSDLDDNLMSNEDWDKIKHTQSTWIDPTKDVEASTSEVGTGKLRILFNFRF